jgi:hypothetical protein
MVTQHHYLHDTEITDLPGGLQHLVDRLTSARSQAVGERDEDKGTKVDLA